MSVNLVSIPSFGFGEDEHACSCCSEDLKGRDVVGHYIIDSKGNKSLSCFIDRECAKTWIKTKIIEVKNLTSARCPTCRKTIKAASILSKQEIDECISNQLQLNSGAHIGTGIGFGGACFGLAVGTGLALSSGPMGFNVTFVGTLIAEAAVLSAADKPLRAFALSSAAGSVIGGIGGAPLLISAVAGVAAPIAIAAITLVSTMVGYSFGRMMR